MTVAFAFALADGKYGNMGSADEAVKAFLAQTLVQNSNPTCDHHDHKHGEGHSCGHHSCGEH